MKQILINLLSNAVKFAYGEQIVIEAGFSAEHRLLTCKITDHGTGFDSEKLELIQALLDQSQEDDDELIDVVSSHFSLFTCKKILDCIGGRLCASSAGENQGATFEFDMKMRALGQVDLSMSSENSHTRRGEDRANDNLLNASFNETQRSSDYMSVFEQVNNRDENCDESNAKLRPKGRTRT